MEKLMETLECRVNEYFKSSLIDSKFQILISVSRAWYLRPRTNYHPLIIRWGSNIRSFDTYIFLPFTCLCFIEAPECQSCEILQFHRDHRVQCLLKGGKRPRKRVLNRDLKRERRGRTRAARVPRSEFAQAVLPASMRDLFFFFACWSSQKYEAHT